MLIWQRWRLRQQLCGRVRRGIDQLNLQTVPRREVAAYRVARLLGIERLEKLAELAREHQRQARADHRSAVERLEQERMRLSRFGQLMMQPTSSV